MSNSWDTLAAKYNASMVGGQLIAFHEGRHYLLGTLHGGHFVLTEDGIMLEAVIDPLDHDGNGEKGGSLPGSTRRRRAAPVEPEATDHVLDLTDGTVIQDKME